jgi:hypothetical protein
MFSEANAESNARQLEVVLFQAIAEGGEVKEFAKKCLYDWYLGECSEAFRSPDPNLIKEYQ